MASLDRCYNIFDLREVAQRRLPKGIFEYVDKGTEDGISLEENRAAFQHPVAELDRGLVRSVEMPPPYPEELLEFVATSDLTNLQALEPHDRASLTSR